MTVRAYISGCAGTELKPEERALFADAPPWGLILFLRNCESPEQIEALVASFRELVGRVDHLRDFEARFRESFTGGLQRQLDALREGRFQPDDLPELAHDTHRGASATPRLDALLGREG